jgi:hypothetical protein
MAWHWTGSGWSAQTSVGPPPGFELTAATDPTLRRVLVFASKTTPGSVTVAWDGANWHDLNPVTTPPASGAARLVYDEARQHMLLYDGHDTWRYLP